MKLQSREVCVTGATGFIGRHLIRSLLADESLHVRCLVRERIPESGSARLTVEHGDLNDRGTLERLLCPGAVLFNLAYDSSATANSVANSARALAAACIGRGVARVIHLSTATVAGVNPEPLIDERSQCLPGTPYEQIKLTLEETLSASLADVPLVILRPTAVFGSGGRNLVKLAAQTVRAHLLRRELLAAFHGDRAMNLVSVDNVVAALLHVGASPGAAARETYFVSDDDAPTNNYRDVERAFAAAFNRPATHGAAAPVPRALRDVLLSVAGRSSPNSARRYSCAKLLASGFKRPSSFDPAVSRYADYLAQQYREIGQIVG